MSLFSKLVTCIAISILISGFYTGWVSSQKLNFVYDHLNFLFFNLATFLTLILTGIPSLTLTKIFRSKFFSSNNFRKTGTVKWFSGSKGFGFIICNNGEELFVHFRSIKRGSKRLIPGAKVKYRVIYGEKGPEATDVVIV